MLYEKIIPAAAVVLALGTGFCVYPMMVRVRRTAVGPTPAQRAAWKRSITLFGQAEDTWKKKKDFPQAEVLYQQAFALDTFDPFLKQSYADMLTVEGKKEQAFAVYRETVHPIFKSGLGPENDPLALNDYVSLSKAVGNGEEARWGEEQIVLHTSFLNPKCSKVTPEQLHSLPVSAMANLAVGAAYQRKGQDAKALAIFTQVAKDYPNLALAHLYRARALETIGFQAKAAQAEYAKASRLGGADAQKGADARRQ